MIGPTHGAGVEQVNQFAAFRIRRCDVAPFEAIALRASIGKIVDVAGAAVFAGNYMVNLVGEEGVFRMHQAVLAAVQRASDPTPPLRLDSTSVFGSLPATD